MPNADSKAKKRTCPAHARKIYVTAEGADRFRCRWRQDTGEHYDYPDVSVVGRERLHDLIDGALDDIERNVAHYQED